MTHGASSEYGAAGRRRVAWARGLACVAVCLGLVFGTVATARADSLDDQKTAAQQQLADTKASLVTHQSALQKASAALAQSNADLAAAKADLAVKKSAVTAAQAEDQRLAGELAQAEAALTAAQAALAAAQAEVAQGTAKLSAQQHEINVTVQTANQQNPALLSLSVLLTSASGANLNNSVQWATTMFDTSEATMSQLRALQEQLVAAQGRAVSAQAQAASAQQAVTAQKAASEAHLAETQQLQKQAQAAEKTVAAQVTANQSAQADAAAAVAQDQADQAEEEAALATIEQQIQERIAAQEAKEKAEREAAAKAAAEKAAAEEAARQAGQDGQSVDTSPATPEVPPSETNGRTSSGTLLGPPLAGALRITSPFGWRTDPITHYRAYHSGVDFGAACGTPVLASESGTVASRVWSSVFGNYIILDHGKINGAYWSTGYAHLSSFAVSAGQQVKRGDIIGYSGTTGRSTGCHLHYNVFKDGNNVNGAPLIGL